MCYGRAMVGMRRRGARQSGSCGYMNLCTGPDARVPTGVCRDG